MKRTLFLFTILLLGIGIGGCNDKEAPTPEETDQENYRTVKLGDDFPIKVGEKILIKDTLYAPATGKTDSIVPVYLNYVLSLDSLKDGRCPIEACNSCDFHPSAKLSFTFANNDTSFELYSPSCEDYFMSADSACALFSNNNCTPSIYPRYNRKYPIPIAGNMGICILLCKLEPVPTNAQPAISIPQTEYKAFLNTFVYNK